MTDGEDNNPLEFCHALHNFVNPLNDSREELVESLQSIVGKIEDVREAINSPNTAYNQFMLGLPSHANLQVSGAADAIKEFSNELEKITNPFASLLTFQEDFRALTGYDVSSTDDDQVGDFDFPFENIKNFTSITENESTHPSLTYESFLWKSFRGNHKSKTYQFAYLAFHLLFMTFVYASLWQIKEAKPEEMKKALLCWGRKNDKKKVLKSKSPLPFSLINESTCFNLFELLGAPQDKIGSWKKIVANRNELTHANGNVLIHSTDNLELYCEKILKACKEIQEFSQPLVQNIYDEFLREFPRSQDIEYSTPKEQISEGLIRRYYLSQEDIKGLKQRRYGSRKLKDEVRKFQSEYTSID